jgi:N-carbamoyl-L-amino-acid hydrolase
MMSGTIDPDRVRALTDAAGVTFADAARDAGLNPAHLGADPETAARIGLFLELHIEQGRGLIDLDSPVAVASSILAHGRWRLAFRGQGNHAGATAMQGRQDPLVAAARAVTAIRDTALSIAGSRATVGRIEVTPGGTNVIPSSVTSWLDARGETAKDTRLLVAEIARLSDGLAAEEGCSVVVTEESWSDAVSFDARLLERLSSALGGVPALASGAGHDAGVLSSVAPTAMLFVRNPTGISHAPEEWAELEDTLAGIDALETVLRSLL